MLDLDTLELFNKRALLRGVLFPLFVKLSLAGVEALLKLGKVVYQSSVVQGELALLVLLLLCMEVLLLKLIAESEVLVLDGDFLADKNLDVVFDRLCISELLEKILDLLLL